MRQMLKARLTGLGVVAAAAAVLYGCSETQTPSPTGVPAFLISENPDVHLCENTDLEAGKVKLLKTGGAGEFEIVVNLNWDGSEIDRFDVTVEDGECAVVHENDSGNFEDITNVTVTELSEDFVNVEWSIILLRGDPLGEFHFGPSTDPIVIMQVNRFKGGKAVYVNEPGDDNGGGGDGCTPGYWKVKPHQDSWAATGFSQTDIYSDVFGVGPSLTLFDAVGAKGGGINPLLRHSVAALLNSSHPDVDYDLSTAEVIALVQDAFATGEFEAIKDEIEDFNEQSCPLN